MIRLAIVTGGLGLGGAEMMLYKLLTRLDHRKFRIEVFSLLGDEVFTKRLRSHDIPVHTADLGPSLGGVVGLLRIRGALVHFGPDLIQGWMYHGNLAALVFSLSLPRKTVVYWGIRQSLVSLSNEKMRTAYLIRLGAKLSESVDGIIYNSNSGARHHEDIGYKALRGKVIPNGFDTNLYRPCTMVRSEVRAELGVSSQELVVAMVARYHPVKDHAGFLAAASRVALAVPLVQFVLVGTSIDWENKQLTNLIELHGLKERVLLLGERTDTHRLYPIFDVFVSSSVAEGFPNVVGEAMASSVPCVVTDVGDCAEIVGETGVVVPSGDPQTLAGAIVNLLQLPEDSRKALGQAARKRISECYSIDVVVGAYQSLYEGVFDLAPLK